MTGPTARVLLTVDEYREELLTDLLAGSGPLTDTEQVPLVQALGRVLAEPVRARGDVPAFANSGMDGYAVCAALQADRAASLGPLRASLERVEKQVTALERDRVEQFGDLRPAQRKPLNIHDVLDRAAGACRGQQLDDPVGVALGPDRSLLVADDVGNMGGFVPVAQEVCDGSSWCGHRQTTDKGHVIGGERGAMQSDAPPALLPAGNREFRLVIQEISHPVQCRRRGVRQHPGGNGIHQSFFGEPPGIERQPRNPHRSPFIHRRRDAVDAPVEPLDDTGGCKAAQVQPTDALARCLCGGEQPPLACRQLRHLRHHLKELHTCNCICLEIQVKHF